MTKAIDKFIFVASLVSLFVVGAAMPHFQVAREAAQRPGTFFFHIQDGYHYHINCRREGTIYFKCVYYERGCHGRAIFDLVDGFVHSAQHIHAPDEFYADEMALRRAILQRCRNLDYATFQQIIDEESRWFDPQVVTRVTFARMRTAMRHARLENYPASPNSLLELSRILMDPQFSVLTMTDDGTDNIYCGSVQDINDGHHIVFLSNRMAQRMTSFSVLHGDGTFRSVPIGPHFAHQVYCIVGVWAHHIVPLAWVLMETRTQIAYTAVIEFLLDRLGDEIELTRMITDFEQAQQNAWQQTLNINVQGCLWHLCRAFIDRLVELHLLQRMRRIPEVRRIIRLTMALPLLPEGLIVQGYHLILQHARNEGNFIYRVVQPFFLYLWRVWVSRPVQRARMSVFGSAQRTNNVCEAFNRILRETVGIHANVFLFLMGLVTLEQRAHNTILALEEGRRVTRGRKRTAIANDRNIHQLSEDLFQPPGPINQAIFRFLRVASQLMDNMLEEALLARRQNNNNN